MNSTSQKANGICGGIDPKCYPLDMPLILSLETPDASSKTGYYTVAFDEASSVEDAVEKLSRPPQYVLDTLMREDEYETGKRINKIITARVDNEIGSVVAAYVLKHSTLHALTEGDVEFSNDLLVRLNRWRTGTSDEITDQPASWWTGIQNPKLLHYIWRLSNKHKIDNGEEFNLQYISNVLRAVMKIRSFQYEGLDELGRLILEESVYRLKTGEWRTSQNTLGELVREMENKIGDIHQGRDFFFVKSLYVPVRENLKENDVYDFMILLKNFTPEDSVEVADAVRASIPYFDVLMRVNAY